MPILDPLVTLDQAQGELAASLPPDQSALAAVISAASLAVRRWTRRDFTLASYDEIQTGRGFSSIWTRQYPISAISALRINQNSTVLSITNTDNRTNQRATAALATTGDYESGLTVTGLSLLRVASGVSYPNTVAFDSLPEPTVQDAAAAVNALGDSWSAKAPLPYSLWAVSDLYPNTGAQNCLNNGSADFQAYTQDVSDYDVYNLSGEIRLRNQTFDPVFALMNLANTSQLSSFPIGWMNLRITYTAGFSTIPPDVQQACLIAVKDWMYQLQIVTAYQSESDVDWSATLSPFLGKGLPDASKALLQPWKSWRQF